MSVVITNASNKTALIMVRSLGRRGLRVTTGDEHKFALASLSRYSASSFLYPSPLDKTPEFVNALLEFVKNNKHDVLIPTGPRDTFIIAKYRPMLEQYIRIPVHDYALLMKANDKAYLMQLAQEMGLPVPKTIFIRDMKALYHQSEVLRYPVVVKLRNSYGTKGMSYVYSKDELRGVYEDTVSRLNLLPEQYPLVQEYIPGQGYGVSLLFNRGQLRAKFTHKRLRENPPSGGPSTYRISTQCPEMESIAIKLLESFNWHGVAMVEFKLDSRTNSPVLLEINPLFWGSLNQAICSGVDFPYLMYRMAMDGDVDPVFSYKTGVKTCNAFPNYFALFKQLAHYPNKYHTLKEFLFCCPDDVISFTDLPPILSYLYAHLFIRSPRRQFLTSLQNLPTDT